MKYSKKIRIQKANVIVMFIRKDILVILIIFISLSAVNAANFDMPSGYQQISSSASMTELENDVGEYIIIADGNYMDIYDFTARLDDDYVISNIKYVKIGKNKVKEYTFSSKTSTKYVYSFKCWGHPYNIFISPNNVLFWNVESLGNPIHQIISSFIV